MSKSGQVQAEPDLAVLHLGVRATGDTAEDVRSELATRSDDVLEALVVSGIDEDDVTTSRFHIRERVDHQRMREAGADPDSREEAEAYRYYEGTHSFRVDVRDVDAAGEVVDTAVDAGANSIDRIEFTLSEERREALREEALGDAIESARSEADFVAARIDATVVDVTTIDTSGGRLSPVREYVEAEAVADDAAPATEFHPGDVTVSATVSVEYEMR